MLENTLARCVNVPVEEVERLLALSPDALYNDPLYLDLVGQLDAATLETTATYARAAYETQLPPIKAKYGLSDTVMSGYTLCNWVLGFLMYPEKLRDMLTRHARIPTDTIEATLPELIAILADLPDGSAEWQQALVTLSLPLIARG